MPHAGGHRYGSVATGPGFSGLYDPLVSDQPPPGSSSYSAYAARAYHDYMEPYVPDLLLKWERQRKGAVRAVLTACCLSNCVLCLLLAVRWSLFCGGRWVWCASCSPRCLLGP